MRIECSKFTQLTISTKIALILVLLTLLGWGISCSSQNEIRPAARQLIRLVEIVHRNFRAKPDFWKLNTEWLIQNSMVPQDMLKDKKIYNALGKLVLVGSGVDGQMIMPGTKSFDIIYKDLSKRECVALAAYEYPKNQTLGLISLTILNDENDKILVWDEENGLPLTTDKAAQLCRNKNILIWNFE